jgi:hypothetical protein
MPGVHAMAQASPRLPKEERVDMDMRQWCFDAFLKHSVLRGSHKGSTTVQGTILLFVPGMENTQHNPIYQPKLLDQHPKNCPSNIPLSFKFLSASWAYVYRKAGSGTLG